jgi:hypothetical protein
VGARAPQPALRQVRGCWAPLGCWAWASAAAAAAAARPPSPLAGGMRCRASSVSDWQPLGAPRCPQRGLGPGRARPAQCALQGPRPASRAAAAATAGPGGRGGAGARSQHQRQRRRQQSHRAVQPGAAPCWSLFGGGGAGAGHGSASSQLLQHGAMRRAACVLPLSPPSCLIAPPPPSREAGT